ncbi:Aldo-keto reductase str7 [Psilocybe cubensis]|uniref:NADP-dependent oxidoreductase domain-containing protein n=2 Tax=Psilocybe cubensis TaxID=181762 RepID=A0A8H8CE41_PSICU|nr:Aldo-keto reductase str7 [Psilocybe cubensis]KAH9477295.1 Aldo-keto reductase str7 [Psilocybe cubensis]
MPMHLPTRKIGEDNVSAIGFGLAGLSGFYGPKADDEERFKILDTALEMGCTNWDTAAFYGDNEELVGKWFKRTGKRDKIFLATKFGITPDGPNGKAEHVRTAIEDNLKRLGIDTIDLYYVHRVDQTTPIEITVRAMAELVKEGKVRYLGLSEVSATTLRRAHAIHPISAVQIEYSPFFLDMEDETIGLLKACRELGIAVVAYSPLGRGVLTGAIKSNDDFDEGDWRKHIPKYSNANFANILKLAAGLEEIGKKYNATAGQIALAWILAQGEDIIPIPGTKKIKYLQENIEAVHIRLSADDVSSVRALATTLAPTIVGDRSRTMHWLFADTPELPV